ncbi:MAG TPA: CDP-diacylglycerol--serine O-phosphatidyltransferase [Gammaproteobacteria bacterium]|nr:CDP-diacylglycerol--serine O-phosphatidyltransferase [Gammaproteobacteria bacterium]
MAEEPVNHAKPGRGIYLLPNLFTTAGLFAGFYAIVAATNDRFEAAAIAVFVAMVTDGMDGRIARLTNTQSDFGKEYDSLADMVAFGLAPALVAYEWALGGLGKIGWLAAFIYAAGAALRLARFNIQHGVSSKRYFQGLASPAAAAVMAGMVWAGASHQWDMNGALSFSVAVITVALALLMVSNIRYRSFKDLDLKGRVPFIAALFIVLTFAFVSIDPPHVLFAIFSLYAVSGPVVTLIFLRKHRAERRHGGGGPGEPPRESA